MTSQEMIEFGSDNEEEDANDVQAILAALQLRKEKQQKMKKAIRERANKSVKMLKDESEAPDRLYEDLLKRMQRGLDDLNTLQQKGTTLLAPLPPAMIREEDEAIENARSQLYFLGEQLVREVQGNVDQTKSALQRLGNKVTADAKRAQNEDLIKALTELQDEVLASLQLVNVAKE